MEGQGRAESNIAQFPNKNGYITSSYSTSLTIIFERVTVLQ